MVTDLQRRPYDRLADPGPAMAGLGARRGPGQWAPIVVLVALVLASLTGWWLGRDDDGWAHRVETGGRPLAAPAVSVLGHAQEAAAPTPTTAVTAPPTTAARVATTATPRRRAATPVATTVAPTTSRPATTSTVAAVSTPVVGPGGTDVTAVTTLAPTTSTTVAGCRNSADPACGPFRFDPQPGSDSPMTVEVAVEFGAPAAGQEVVFRLTLTDPDGVSYNGTVFGFGDGGLAGSSYPPCEKFGPWDPPPRDAAAATEVLVVRHTYLQPGTYPVSFAFDAGPFSCVDSTTGRGDRPYASSATGTATVVVG